MQAKIWRVPQIFSLLGYLLILISVSALLGYGSCAFFIGEIVFIDLNCDGIQDAGEPGIEGIVLKWLDSEGNLIETATTDANGEYKFWTWGHSRTYTIDVDESALPDGFVLTTGNEPLTFTMEQRKDFLDANFGYGQCDGDVPPGDEVSEDDGTFGLTEPSETGGVVLALQTANSGANSANVAVGNTINLQLVVTSSEAVNGVSAYLSYSPAVLGVVDVGGEPGIQPFTKGDFIGGMPFENSAADGVLRYSEGNVLSGATGTGVVASVSFVVHDVPEGGTTAISFLSDAAIGLMTGVSSGGTILHTTVTGFTLNVENIPVTLPGDVNGDGSVNLADFSILAAVFGTTNSRADFNGDGFVTLADFSILASNFGNTVGDVPDAPSALLADAGSLSLRMPAKLHRGDVVEVAVMAEDVSLKAYSFILSYDTSMLRLLKGGITEGDFPKDTLFVAREDGRVFSASRSGEYTGTGVLTKLRFSVVADGAATEGYDAIALRDVQIVDGSGRFSHLPELHAVPTLKCEAMCMVPHKTRLLANYPNPFNPDTWIPFELADDANVNIQIYDISGHLVRTISLGYRPAGRYVDRSASAYWDGRNFSGERIASGLYLYRLTAGNFSAVRRMVVLK